MIVFSQSTASSGKTMSAFKQLREIAADNKCLRDSQLALRQGQGMAAALVQSLEEQLRPFELMAEAPHSRTAAPHMDSAVRTPILAAISPFTTPAHNSDSDVAATAASNPTTTSSSLRLDAGAASTHMPGLHITRDGGSVFIFGPAPRPRATSLPHIGTLSVDEVDQQDGARQVSRDGDALP